MYSGSDTQIIIQLKSGVYGPLSVSWSGQRGVGLFLVGDRTVTELGLVPRAAA